MTRPLKNKRGVALVAVGVFLSALLAFTVIAVDIGRLAHTATEVQTVADASAAAGAKALWEHMGTPGTSDPDAHVVASKNVMNGSLPTTTDVDVVEGNYDPQTLTFTPGGAKRRAVRATAQTTVNNLVAGIFDFFSGGRITATPAPGTPNKTSVVQKRAIAGFLGTGAACGAPMGCAVNDFSCYCTHNAAPCLPIGIPDCELLCSGTTCDLPKSLTVAPNTDTAAWTVFSFASNVNESNIRSLFPPQCAPGTGNGTQDIGTQTAFGGQIVVNNGMNSNLNAKNNVFALTKCVAIDQKLGCVDTSVPPDGVFDATGGSSFTVPVFHVADCSQQLAPNQQYDLVGFVTITIASVDDTGIHLSAISHQETGTLGGEDFGSGRVALVQ